MPIYEYECAGGEGKVELQLPVEHEQPKCVDCGAPMTRIYNAPTIQFKGSGFYSTGG